MSKETPEKEAAAEKPAAKAAPAEKKQGKTRRPSAQKRDIQSEKRRLRNRAFKSRVRTAIRRFEEELPKGDEKTTKACLSEVYSLMDKGVQRGTFKLNKASRTKARLTARLVSKA